MNLIRILNLIQLGMTAKEALDSSKQVVQSTSQTVQSMKEIKQLVNPEILHGKIATDTDREINPMAVSDLFEMLDAFIPDKNGDDDADDRIARDSSPRDTHLTLWKRANLGVKVLIR